MAAMGEGNLNAAILSTLLTNVLELRGLSKCFGGLEALRSLEVEI